MRKIFIIILSSLFILQNIVVAQTSYKSEIDSLLQLKAENKEKDEIYIDLEIAMVHFRSGTDSLDFYMKLFREYLKEHDNKEIEAYLFKFKAEQLEIALNLNSSIILKRKALELFRELEDYLEMGILSNEIGNDYFRLGNYTGATESYLQALAFHESIDYTQGIGDAYNNLGRVSLETKYFDKALEYFESSLVIWEEYGNFDKCHKLYNNIGSLLFEKEKYNEALLMFSKAAKGFEKNGNLLSLAVVYNNIALSYSELKQLPTAIKYIHRSLEICQDQGHQLGIISSYISLANFAIQERAFYTANDYLKKALQMSVNYKIKAYEMDIYDEFSSLYEKQEEYKLAYQFRIKYDSLNDLLMNEDSQKRMEELMLSYEQRLGEKEIVQLKASQKMQARINTIFLLVIVLAFFLVLILVYAYNSKKKNSAITEEKNRLLKDYNDRLIKSEDSLKLMIEDKNRLFSVVAHDIRNPVAAVVGFSELLFDNFDKIDDKTKKEYMLQILQGSARTSQLLENLLLWARSQMDKITVTKRDILLSSLIGEGISPTLSILKKKNLELVLEGDSDFHVMVDVEMLKAILRNLITNAIKFSFQDKSIRVSTLKKDDCYYISVIDEGVGMTLEAVTNLFSPSNNTSTAGTAGETGSGLGLLICKDYTERIDGTIEVKSEAGKGTSITVCLPMK